MKSETFTERMMQMSQASDRPVEPLLVMGNPRIGTTLLDTILGMHPEVVSGGKLSVGPQLENELTPLLDSYLNYPECLTKLRIEDANALAHQYSNAVSGLSQGRRFVTNKALNINSNWAYSILITPGMRTISLHRHPLDNCVSCFMSLIPMRNHGYVQDQEKMSRVWITRRMLQDHWAEVMPDQPILQLHYESMVNNQAFETKGFWTSSNLDFDESCLRFHESSTVAATTVSSKQVQQPMYNTSAGRWQRYEKHLSILIDRLNPWLNDQSGRDTFYQQNRPPQLGRLSVSLLRTALGEEQATLSRDVDGTNRRGREEPIQQVRGPR